MPTNTTDGPDATPTLEPVEIVCDGCKQTFTVEVMPKGTHPLFDVLRGMLPKFCNACHTASIAAGVAEAGRRSAAEHAAAQVARWETLCLPAYRNTDPARLDQKAVARLAKWTPDGYGFCLAGKSRAGKTRLMLHTLKRLHFAGLSVAFVSSVQFGHDIARHSSESQSDLDRYLRGLIRADVLAIDDVGKEKATDRVESEFYFLLEQRTGNLRSILLTTQLSDKEILAKFSPDRGPAILGRINDFCTVLPVVKPTL